MHRLDWRWTLCAIVGVALFLRLWGAAYGLPFSYYSDEYHEVMRALELGMGRLNPDRVGKGGFYFLLFAEYAAYYVFLKLSGVVAGAQDFAKLFVRDPTAFYLMGRVSAALLGTATVAVAFMVGRHAYSVIVGLLAALFLGLNILHIDLSRRVGVDVPMTLLAITTLYFALRIVDRGKRSDYLFAALFAALATTTKLTGLMLVVPLLIAHAYAVARHELGLARWFMKPELWLSAVVFGVVLFITEPGFVRALDFVSLFASHPGDAGDLADVDPADGAVLARPNLWLYYLDAMRASMGWPLFVLAMVGAAYAVYRRKAADVILLSYALATLAVIASTTSEKLFYPRYALPVIVVMLILAGRSLAELGARLGRRQWTAMAAITVICLAAPIKQVLETATALAQPDPRTLAKDWFEANVAVGSKVAIEGLKIGPIKTTVQLHDTRAAMQRRMALWQDVEPKQAKFLALQLAVHEGGGYDLDLIQIDSVATLDDYAARGVDYFVIRPDSFLATRSADTGSVRLVNELRSDPRTRLLKRFEGKGMAWPTVEIYRLDHAAHPANAASRGRARGVAPSSSEAPAGEPARS